MSLMVKFVFKERKSDNSPLLGFLEEETQSTCKYTNEINMNRNSTFCSRLDIDILKERKIHVVLIIHMSVPKTHFQLASYAYGDIGTIW